MRTQGREHHTLGSFGEGQQGVGRLGEITWGKMPDTGDGGMEAANYLAMYVPMQ